MANLFCVLVVRFFRAALLLLNRGEDRLLDLVAIASRRVQTSARGFR